MYQDNYGKRQQKKWHKKTATKTYKQRNILFAGPLLITPQKIRELERFFD